ncbi:MULTISPECIES: DUF2501 domain-containing protein [Rahnella]|jgi:hypothetical protein|uniref:DUF2501 domain-containing protein n=1 Tax=Rahnella victoriana TaxID=1510570 RepID=A0ABS0DT54_9GAMM|nr:MULTISPECIES: DUF2501 domain-containing protein [Rahnella]VTQ52985.1 Protein of uncharacterised function (DUF2501) [Campylobacter jejuni]MBF7955809.1 DUF2501 domain-containing protein [Rahnella victoriana]PBI79237.1 hypothetical protein A9993_05610 [Rahnella victoriana]TBX32098.1 DUF2501 domain-containing protein [Rahnella victoriana]TDS85618.1 uncharacterized protein DUF2501 [Rahnella sp. BIGb0236]
MKALQAVVLTLASAGLFLSAGAQASNNLLGQLQQAASDGLNGSSKSGSTGTTSSLTSLLSGGDSALTSTSASNAAGVLQYCVKNNVLSKASTENVKDQLLNKLGIQSASGAESQDYQQGLGGLLKTGKDQSVDLNNLGSGLTQVKEKVKTKACDVVLKQAKSFI